MAAAPAPAGARRRLATAHNLWLATVRPDGRPHLAPVWFVWTGGAIYVCTAPDSVKARNLESERRTTIALENALQPLLCEGSTVAVRRPWPRPVVEAFRRKYDWSIRGEREYSRLLRFVPRRWISW